MTDHTKCWQAYRAIGTLSIDAGGCKMVQPLWETICQLLKN